jgi:hypothetical protein
VLTDFAFCPNAAREMGHPSLSNALSLCVLYEREQDPKFERAARRWVRRVQIEHSLRRQEVELLRAAMAALGSRFDAAALNALLEACRELRVVPPTLPGSLSGAAITAMTKTTGVN